MITPESKPGGMIAAPPLTRYTREYLALETVFLKSNRRFQKSLGALQTIKPSLAKISRNREDFHQFRSLGVTAQIAAGFPNDRTTGEFEAITRYTSEANGAFFTPDFTGILLEFRKPTPVLAAGESETGGEPRPLASNPDIDIEAEAGPVAVSEPLAIDIDQIADKVYQQIERRLKSERQRIGR